MRHYLKEVPESCFEQILNCFEVVTNVLLLHELVFWILNQFSETYHQAPRIWSTGLKSL